MSLRQHLQSRATRVRAGGDGGAAVITVILLLLAMTAVTTTVSVVATNDTISAGQDRQALSALATADAGVAQALEYIRANGVGDLDCPVGSAPSACASLTRWANPGNPMEFQVGGGTTCAAVSTCYEVHIQTVRAYNPPAVKTGIYRIFSTGRTGTGPGTKRVVVDVDVTPSSFPIGVYGDELDGNGGTRIFSEILFTQDCVSPRNNSPSGSGNGTRFSNTRDPYWGEFAGANSTTFVSTGNNCSAGGRIHQTADCPNNTALNYDRSSLGGPVPPGPCRFDYTRPDGTLATRDSTLFTLQILQEQYGFRAGGLSDDEYEALRQRSQAQGLYNPTASINALLTSAVASGINNPVLYFDNLSQVNLSRNDIPDAFGRLPGSACVPKSVVVVVRNGNLVYQGGNSATRSLALFVPEGDFRGNGGYDILGTLFARNISLGGNEKFELDDCFVDNLPGPLLQLTVTSFREEDRTDVG